MKATKKPVKPTAKKVVKKAVKQTPKNAKIVSIKKQTGKSNDADKVVIVVSAEKIKSHKTLFKNNPNRFDVMIKRYKECKEEYEAGRLQLKATITRKYKKIVDEAKAKGIVQEELTKLLAA